MALRTEAREIDGLIVTVTQFPALRALGLATRVAQAIAPALSQGLSTTSPLALLFSGMDSDATEKLAVDMLASTTAQLEGRDVLLMNRAMIDVAFAGRLPTMVKAVAFAIEVNFSSFFTELNGAPDDPAPSGPAASG